jgi:acyl carrier protein
MNRLQIEKDLREIVRALLPDASRSIALSDRLTADLRIDSDDLSYEMVPELERHFEIKVPVKEWRQVFTVGDLVALVERHSANPR